MTGAVALTFDDGPDPVWTPRILDALARAGAVATFFVVAPLAERHAALVQRMAAGGHEVGLHCVRHVRHDRMTATEVFKDAEGGLRALEGVGLGVRDWRTPWGVVTPASESAAERLNLRLVGWTADSEDWRGADAGSMLERLDAELGDGAVVLMHDGTGPGALREGAEETAELVAPLVDLLRRRGLETVGLGGISGPVTDRNPGGVSSV